MPGYDKELLVLPFDHRASFQEKMFGIYGAPTVEQTALVASYKTVIYEGFERSLATGGRPTYRARAAAARSRGRPARHRPVSAATRPAASSGGSAARPARPAAPYTRTRSRRTRPSARRSGRGPRRARTTARGGPRRPRRRRHTPEGVLQSRHPASLARSPQNAQPSSSGKAIAPAGLAQFLTSSATIAFVVVSRTPARSMRRHAISSAIGFEEPQASQTTCTL